MSFDHWWVGLYIDAPAYDALKPHFAAAAARAVLSPQSQAAIEAWRLRPSDFEQGAARATDRAALVNDFIGAFNLPGFDELAARMLTEGGALATFAPQERLAQMVIAARNAPVGILWHALGYERASQLPGRMGNLLLHPREIAGAIARTHDVYAGTTSEGLLDTARRLAGQDVDDAGLREIIDFLPSGLTCAQELGRGFLALARPQI